MDVKDQIRHTTHPHPGVHLCHRCGWPFPNPHPSAKHRRAHKKICGTIHGYTIFAGSDDDKEKNPSTSELLNAPTEISKVNTGVEVSEKIVKKSGESEITTVCDSTEANLELNETGLVKDGLMGHAPEPSHIFNSQETKSIDAVETGEEKGQESQTSETSTGELTKTSPEVSTIVGKDHDNVKQGNFEKLGSSIADGISEGVEQEIRSDCEHVREVVNKYETVEEANIEKFESEYEISPEVVKESETNHLEGISEETKHEKSESHHKHAPEVAKESETVENVSVLIEKEDFGASNVQIQELFKEPVVVLNEKKDREAHELEKGSIEQIQEVVKEPNTVLTKKEDLGGAHLEKQLNEHTREVVENPISVLTEKQDLGAPELEKSSKEQIQEVVKQPATVLTEKEDLGGAHLEEQSNEGNHEVVKEFDSVLTGSQDLGAPELKKSSKEHVEEANLILTEKEDLGALKSENCSKDEVIEQKVDSDNSVVADGSVDNSIFNGKNASDVVHVPIVEEGKMNNQYSGAALSVASSSRSSLEGNWGSVSVLSTASIDAGTLQSTEKSKVNSRKSNAAASDPDIFEPPSFMTLVEPESKDKKPESSEAQDSQKQLNSSEVSQAGWFPTISIVKVNNESEGRRRNEEAIAKVTNWSTGKPLKNLLGEVKAPSEPVVQKDEAIVKSLVKDGGSSPPKLIDDDDDKKGRKKVKGIISWVPFGCCSSVNVVN